MSRTPTAEHADAELLRAFLQGRQDAFTQLAERYAGLVYGVATRRSPSAAEEIVQNVFLTLARKADRLDASRGLGAWLHQVATRESSNHIRKEANRQRAMQKYAEEFQQDIVARSVDPAWRGKLDESLAGMAAADLDLIVMRYFES